MRTVKQWNSSADWYNQNMGAEGDDLNKNIIRPEIFKLIGDINGKTILDAGCGSGYLSAELAKKAESIVGTDHAERFIEICTDKYKNISNLEFYRQDIQKKFTFEDKSFDIIISKMVLQYVPQFDTFSKECYRLLKPNGQLILVVDHPFDTQFYYAQGLAGKSNPKYYNLQDYFSKGERTKLSLWGKVKLTWYQRTVSDYINPFAACGLKLTKMLELPEMNSDGIKVPRILILKFNK